MLLLEETLIAINNNTVHIMFVLSVEQYTCAWTHQYNNTQADANDTLMSVHNETIDVK